MNCNKPLPCPDHPKSIHHRVYEYDGAFRCLNCKAQWGALPGKPTMPERCAPEASILVNLTTT